MSKKSSTKGANGERELQRILCGRGYKIVRHGTQSFGQWPDLEGLPGIHIECKRVEKLNLSAAMEQATRDAQKFDDGVPSIFHRRNREPWMVTMQLDDWLTIYQQAVGSGALAVGDPPDPPARKTSAR